jgi:hypothetical protein
MFFLCALCVSVADFILKFVPACTKGFRLQKFSDARDAKFTN